MTLTVQNNRHINDKGCLIKQPLSRMQIPNYFVYIDDPSRNKLFLVYLALHQVVLKKDSVVTTDTFEAAEPVKSVGFFIFLIDDNANRSCPGQ